MHIYRILNNLTMKSYVGQTQNAISVRWNQHKQDAKRRDSHFSRALKKYDDEVWTIEELEEIDNVDLLNEREIFWIEHFDSFKNGYNSSSGGENGHVMSEETKKKMSIAALGHKRNLGRKHSPETLQKMAHPHKQYIRKTIPSEK